MNYYQRLQNYTELFTVDLTGRFNWFLHYLRMEMERIVVNANTMELLQE